MITYVGKFPVLVEDDFDASRAFLSSTDPETSLPPNFSAFDETGDALPKLLRNGNLEKVLKSLPVVSVDDVLGLSSPHASLLLTRLTFLGHGFGWEKWREDKVRRYLPANISVPLRLVAARFGLPPTLTYEPYALKNFRVKDPTRPLTEVENLELIQNFLGGPSETWFITVHVSAEARIIPAVHAVPKLADGLFRLDGVLVKECLETIDDTFCGMNAIMLRMPEGCDPREYYTNVRPYLYAWWDKELFPRGMWYRGGNSSGGEHIRHRGETGAQSSIIPLFDRLFGVEHEKSDLSEHLHDMLHIYTPVAHRKFVLQYENFGMCSREYLRKMFSDSDELLELYWKCRLQIAKFRKTHLHYAGEYIAKQSAISKKTNSPSIGSGNTEHIKSLGKHYEETLRGCPPHLLIKFQKEMVE